MAFRIIDEFSVKPSGFLASWRYRRVLIDENGNTTTEPVPGKPYANLPCISDYNKKNRRYNDGDLITEFCNLETFTNYRVYAQNCDPFVNVQTDLNASKCGYLTPLPEPSVPYNPFGSPTYGEYYYFDYCDINGVPVSVKIFKKSYAGVPIQIQEGGASPVVINYQSEDEDNKFSPFITAECRITIKCLQNFEFQKFYTDDEREYKVEVRKDGVLKFAGYLIPDQSEEPFKAPPYDLTLVATDSIGSLKTITYPAPIGNTFDIKQSFKDIVCFCLAKTNLDLPIRTTCNVYEIKMSNEIDFDPLDQAKVNPLNMCDSKGQYLSSYEALKEVCKLFSLRVYQEDGYWNVERVAELSWDVVRRRVYNHTGLFLYSEVVDNAKIAGKDKEVKLVDNSHRIRIGNAYKRVETKLRFKNPSALLPNGGFEDYDGQTFAFWTKYGGISVSQVQKTIRGAGGAIIPIADYAIQFNQRRNSGKWMEASPIYVEEKDTLTFTIKCLTKILPVTSLSVRLKVGSYYLYCKLGTKEFKWVQSLATTSLFLYENQSTFQEETYV